MDKDTKFSLIIEDCKIKMNDFRKILLGLGTTCIITQFTVKFISTRLILEPTEENKIFKMGFAVEDEVIGFNDNSDPINNLEKMTELCSKLTSDTKPIIIDYLHISASKYPIIMPWLQAKRALTLEDVQQAFKAIGLQELLQLDTRLSSYENLANVNTKIMNRVKDLAKIESFPFTLAPLKEQSVNALIPYERDVGMTRDELEMQRQVCHRFFRVGGSQKPDSDSMKLVKNLNQQNSIEMKLDGYSMRSWIIALSKLQQGNANRTFIFLIGKTRLIFKPAEERARVRQKFNMWINLDRPNIDPYVNAVATFFKWTSSDTRSFSECLPYGEQLRTLFERITGEPARTSILITKMKTKSQKIESFNVTDFNKEALVRLPHEQEITSSDKNYPIANWLVNMLNFINFLTLGGEVIRRLYRNSNGQPFNYFDQKAIKSDLLPVAILQSRTLALLGEGIISWRDAFGESGVFTKFNGYGNKPRSHHSRYNAVNGQESIGHIETTESKSIDINSLFNHAFNFGKTCYRFQMKAQLKECYGNTVESDNEEYSDGEYEHSQHQVPVYSSMDL